MNNTRKTTRHYEHIKRRNTDHTNKHMNNALMKAWPNNSLTDETDLVNKHTKQCTNKRMTSHHEVTRRNQ